MQVLLCSMLIAKQRLLAKYWCQCPIPASPGKKSNQSLCLRAKFGLRDSVTRLSATTAMTLNTSGRSQQTVIPGFCDWKAHLTNEDCDPNHGYSLRIFDLNTGDPDCTGYEYRYHIRDHVDSDHR